MGGSLPAVWGAAGRKDGPGLSYCTVSPTVVCCELPVVGVAVTVTVDCPEGVPCTADALLPQPRMSAAAARLTMNAESGAMRVGARPFGERRRMSSRAENGIANAMARPVLRGPGRDAGRRPALVEGVVVMVS